MFDVNNYKGVYFGNDTNEQKFYEGGAHFKYSELYNILENLVLTMPLERRGTSEEPKKKTNIDIIETNENNNNSRNTRNIKPLIESLTQKLSDITKDKGNEGTLEIFTFGEGRTDNNNYNNNNNNNDNNNINPSRNFIKRENVPNNSKVQVKNQSINSSNNQKKNKIFINEDSNIKNSFDFRKNILQKMSYIHNNKKNNFSNKKLLNISHGKPNNSRNNNNIFDILKMGNTSKDILNQTTNVQKMIPLYTDINQNYQSSSFSKSKNSKNSKNSKEIKKKIKNFNYNNQKSISVHNKSISSNKPKTTININKKHYTGNIVINKNNNISKRHLLFNLLKKNNNHNKALSIHEKSSNNGIDTNSNYHTSSNNNNYAEISLLSDLNSSHSKKKIVNINHNNISNDYSSNNITTNNNIIVKPKINISFVNNINTIPAQKINKSRNKQIPDSNSNNTLNKLNNSYKKNLLNEIYKTTHFVNKKSFNTPIRNKLVGNINITKKKNNKPSLNKMSRNITTDKVLKNSINLTEQYMNLKKNINHLKINSKVKNNNIQKMSYKMGKITLHKTNLNKSNIKNLNKGHNRSFFK